MLMPRTSPDSSSSHGKFLDGLINQPEPFYVAVSRGDGGQYRQGAGRDEREIDSLGGRRRVGQENFEFS